MADVFLSYASEDRARITPIIERIEQAGYSVWWDRRIDVGSSFDRVIEQQLDSARCVVVLWSRHSIESDWVRNEAQEGLDRRVLAPACLDEVRPPLAFRRAQTADLVKDGDGLEKLIAAVGGIVGEPGAQSTSPRPRGPATAATREKSGRRWLWPAAVGVLVLAGMAWWASQNPVAPSRGSSSGQAEKVIQFRSIAVLAPVVYDGEPADQVLASVLHEDVIRNLSQVREFRMIGKTTVDRFSQAAVARQAWSDELNASHMVETSLRRVSDGLNVSVSIIEIVDGETVWSHRFEMPDDGSGEIEKRLATRLSGLLQAQFSWALPLVAQPVDPEALALYEAADAMNFGPEVAGILQRAIAIEPNFLEAHAHLADVYCGGPPSVRDLDQCLVHARKLVEIAPEDPAMTEFYGRALVTNGQVEEGVAQYRRSESLDERWVSVDWAILLMQQGYAVRATAKLERYRRLFPFSCGGALEEMLIATGRPAEAREVSMERDGYCTEYPNPVHVPWSYVHEGRLIEAVHSITELYDVFGTDPGKLQQTIAPIMLARILISLGDRENALLWVERSEAMFDADFNTLNARMDLALGDDNFEAYDKSFRRLGELYGFDVSAGSTLVSAIMTFRAGDPAELEALYGYTGMDMLTSVDPPSWLLFAHWLGQTETANRIAGDIRAYYGAGRGSWTMWAGSQPGIHDLPGEGRKQFALALAALTLREPDAAMAAFERARLAGWRDVAVLDYFGLLDDPHGIYDGFVEDPRWVEFVERLRAENAADLVTLREQVPGLFGG